MKKLVFPILMICALLLSCNNKPKEIVVTKVIISEGLNARIDSSSLYDNYHAPHKCTLIVITRHTNMPDSIVSIHLSTHLVSRAKFDSIKEGDVFK